MSFTSSLGRQQVEFYLVKAFNEALSTAVRGRIGGIEPKRSTRMGTALRHATEKLSTITARSRHIVLPLRRGPHLAVAWSGWFGQSITPPTSLRPTRRP